MFYEGIMPTGENGPHLFEQIYDYLNRSLPGREH